MAFELDAATLRDKYGEPLARGTFQVRPNVHIVVSYGRGSQVCKIEFSKSLTKKELEEVIDELVPPAERGKKLGDGLKIIGGHSVSWVHYERIIIRKTSNGEPGVTILFSRPDCHQPNRSQYHEA